MPNGVGLEVRRQRQDDTHDGVDVTSDNVLKKKIESDY